MIRDIDDVDRGILRALQRDARDTTAQAMAESVDASASTVRNRIGRLEASGIIEGYVPLIGYDAAGLSVLTRVVCSAPQSANVVEPAELLRRDGVVQVSETVADTANVTVTVVGTDGDDVECHIDGVRDTGVTVERTDIVSVREMRPCNHPRLIGVTGSE